MLRDLGELVTLAKQQLQEVNIHELADMAIPESFARSPLFSKLNKYTAIIRTNDGKTVYAPHQWFIQAYYVVDFVAELAKYKSAFDSIFSDKSMTEKNNIASSAKNARYVPQEIRDKISSYFVEAGDTDLFIRWMTDYAWWGGGRTIERGDFDENAIVELLGIPVASQSYLLRIVDLLIENNDLRDGLRNSIDHTPNQPSRRPVSSLELYKAWNYDLLKTGYSLPQLLSDVSDREPDSLERRLVLALQAKRFVILTGLSGSGKTRLAQAFVKWISPSSAWLDPFSIGNEVLGENTKYRVVKADKISVVLESLSNGDKVHSLIPRDLIEVWAKYIQDNQLPRSTPSLQIRDAVNDLTLYSNQNNSFHAPLKASAFALINSWEHPSPLPHVPYNLVAVGADWTNRDPILGYVDGISGIYKTEAPLELILNARKYPDIPHFLVLDEMNLSHVERYFADILSAIESDEDINLHSSKISEPPSRISLPDNLFIIGTVNIDETTYMFSPKVLDRANVIEFRASAASIGNYVAADKPVDLSALAGKGVEFSSGFVQNARLMNTSLPKEVADHLSAELKTYFEVLSHFGVEFGFRTAEEIKRYVYFHMTAAKLENEEVQGYDYVTGDLSKALDAQIFQKLLTRLHGSRRKLEPVLCSLAYLCETSPMTDDRAKSALTSASTRDQILSKIGTREELDNKLATVKYPLTYEKVVRMLRRIEDGFTSFAEA